MKIRIVGGGPGGLYLAYLLKRRRPDFDIVVLERNPPDATFGFGVVLADRGLQHLEEADETAFRRIAGALHWIHGQVFTVDGDAVPFDKKRGGGAIERLTLLRLLQGLCTEAGIGLHFGRSVADIETLDGDLIVGADGANSLVRDRFADAFGTARRVLTNRFAWYGTAKAFDRSYLNFKTIPGGALVGHYYPYLPDRSTFVMECDEHTWFAAGLDRMDDDARRRFTEQFFAEELGGTALIANHSLWRQFVAVTNRHWHHAGRYVLIGDALRVAHFSIGSGTRLAFEDAVALAAAIDRHPTDVPAALDAYVAIRAPQREKLDQAAIRSFDWYENFHARMAGIDGPSLAYDFLMRTGRIDPGRLERDFPTFVAAYRTRREAASV